VHLGIIFVNNQLDAQFFSYIFITVLQMFRAYTKKRTVHQVGCLQDLEF